MGREYAAIGPPARNGQIWDGRWKICSPESPEIYLRALGPDGLKQAAGRPDGAPVARVLHCLPAAFRGDVLVACPHLGYGQVVISQQCVLGFSFAASFDPH